MSSVIGHVFVLLMTLSYTAGHIVKDNNGNYKLLVPVDVQIDEKQIRQVQNGEVCPDNFDSSILKMPNSTCDVFCYQNDSLILKSPLKCLSNGNWSKVPRCVDEGNKCPELPKQILSNCNRKPGTTCDVRCKTGNLVGPEEITCGDDGQWLQDVRCTGELEAVENSGRTACAKAKLPKNVTFVTPSCKKSHKMECAIGCKTLLFNGGPKPWKIVFIRRSKCMPTGEWDNLPNCVAATHKYWDSRVQNSQCSSSDLGEHLKLDTDCKLKQAEECSLTCDEGYYLVGPDTVTCNMRKWSTLPTCRPKTLCPDLADANVLLKNCSRLPNTNCDVQCKEDRILNGPSTITCLENSMWSDIVSCREEGENTDSDLVKCQAAEMPKDVYFSPRDCQNSGHSECKIGCKALVFNVYGNKLKLVAIRKSKCLPSGEWSNIPNCEAAQYYFWDKRINEQQCSDPTLPPNARTDGSCSHVPGSNCTIICEDGYNLMGSNITRCIKKEWLYMPVCERIENPEKRSESVNSDSDNEVTISLDERAPNETNKTFSANIEQQNVDDSPMLGEERRVSPQIAHDEAPIEAKHKEKTFQHSKYVIMRNTFMRYLANGTKSSSSSVQRRDVSLDNVTSTTKPSSIPLVVPSNNVTSTTTPSSQSLVVSSNSTTEIQLLTTNLASDYTTHRQYTPAPEINLITEKETSTTSSILGEIAEKIEGVFLQSTHPSISEVGTGKELAASTNETSKNMQQLSSSRPNFRRRRHRRLM